MRQELINKVLLQIEEDVAHRDTTAIEELISTLSDNKLKGFLQEYRKDYYNE